MCVGGNGPRDKCTTSLYPGIPLLKNREFGKYDFRFFFFYLRLLISALVRGRRNFVLLFIHFWNLKFIFIPFRHTGPQGFVFIFMCISSNFCWEVLPKAFRNQCEHADDGKPAHNLLVLLKSFGWPERQFSMHLQWALSICWYAGEMGLSFLGMLFILRNSIF